MSEKVKNAKVSKLKKGKSENKGKSKLSAFEQELVKAIEKVKGYLLPSEASICFLIYSNPDILYNCELSLDDFKSNTWRVYFAIAESLILKEKKSVLDDITVGLYLEKHKKLKAKYEEYGGYETISTGMQYAKMENKDGLLSEIKKWNVILKMLKLKFPVFDRLSEFADMTAEEIYGEYEALLNHIFVNIDGDVKSYNATDELYGLIDELNKGSLVGMPLNDSKLLSNEISGVNKGHIYLFGAGTGVGKSSTMIHWLLPSVIKYDKKALLIINEEDESKIRSELLIYVINNVFNVEFKKHKLRNGKYDDETLNLLRKAADWLEEKKEKKNITIIPMEKYSAKMAIKLINKYASLSVDFIVLDTLKPSSDSKTDVVWLELQRDMVDIYNTIKPTNKNVAMWVNYQLGKAALNKRYYTTMEIGVSKSIADVASVNLMMRQLHDDELSGGKNEIKAWKSVGKTQKVPVELENDGTRRVVIFVTKNRFGVANSYQIIAEHDLSTNKYREIGYCSILPDF